MDLWLNIFFFAFRLAPEIKKYWSLDQFNLWDMFIPNPGLVSNIHIQIFLWIPTNWHCAALYYYKYKYLHFFHCFQNLYIFFMFLFIFLISSFLFFLSIWFLISSQICLVFNFEIYSHFYCIFDFYTDHPQSLCGCGKHWWVLLSLHTSHLKSPSSSSTSSLELWVSFLKVCYRVCF